MLFYSTWALRVLCTTCLIHLSHTLIQAHYFHTCSPSSIHTHIQTDGCTGEQLDVQYLAWRYFDMKTGTAARNWTIIISYFWVFWAPLFSCSIQYALEWYLSLTIWQIQKNVIFSSRPLKKKKKTKNSWFMKRLPCICLYKIWGNEHTEQVWGRDNLA